MVLLRRLFSSAHVHSFFFFLFFPRLSDSPSPCLSVFALDLCGCTRVRVRVCGSACVLKQRNLLRSDQKKRGNPAKLPGSGCVQGSRAHAHFRVYLFFASYLFAVAEGLRGGGVP